MELQFHPDLVSEQVGSSGNISDFYSRSGYFEIRKGRWLIALI
jgi:hypothetical protein